MQTEHEEEFNLTRLLWGPASKPPHSDERLAPETGALHAPASDQPSVTTSPRSNQPSTSSDIRSSVRSENSLHVSAEDEIIEIIPGRTAAAGFAFLGGVDRGPHIHEETADYQSLDDDLELAVLAAELALAESEDLDTDERGAGLSGRDHTHEQEPPLSQVALTRRLHGTVLPRLRAQAASPGYLTLGNLARTVVDLQRSELHLHHVRAFVEKTSVPVFPFRIHSSHNSLPLWTIEDARCRFGDLVRGRPDENLVVSRAGYGSVPLEAGTRAFLMDAWMCHCLARVEEERYARIVVGEIARVGEAVDRWSPQAREARDALILDNLWRVVRVARNYVGRGVEVDDLFQFGALGLHRGILKFDPSQGCRLMTYVSNWIFQSIMRGIADTSRLIRVPVHVHDRGEELKDVEGRLWNELRRDPTPREIAEAAGVDEAAVRAHLITAQSVSLDDVRFASQLSSLTSRTENPVACAELHERHVRIAEILGTLTERQRLVLELRFGLGDGRAHTLEEVGLRLGVSRERIRQIEEKALGRLRHPSRMKWIEDFKTI